MRSQGLDIKRDEKTDEANAAQELYKSERVREKEEVCQSKNRTRRDCCYCCTFSSYFFLLPRLFCLTPAVRRWLG